MILGVRAAEIAARALRACSGLVRDSAGLACGPAGCDRARVVHEQRAGLAAERVRTQRRGSGVLGRAGPTEEERADRAG